MTDHQVVSRGEWLAARDELLQREKEHPRMADEWATTRSWTGRRKAATRAMRSRPGSAATTSTPEVRRTSLTFWGAVSSEW